VIAAASAVAALMIVALAVTPVAGSVAASAGRAAAVTSADPLVQTMVVGKGGRILFGARNLTASATTLSISGRACAVAGGTALADLAAIHRAGGPTFGMRDYGHCGASASSSAELFVYTVGGQTNRGQDGWEYKVDSRSGTTGAGDPSGPQGDGRLLQAGDRVLWFWCEATAGGCQRTMEMDPSSTLVAPGQSITVAVRGFENEGRSSAVAGAGLSLGSDIAATGAAGRAQVRAPRTPGRYELSANHRGMVPPFPWAIVVR